MRYEVTITRVESFTIEAESAEQAVDLAFEHTHVRDRDPKDNQHDPPEIVEHDCETTDHTVEEQQGASPGQAERNRRKT